MEQRKFIHLNVKRTSGGQIRHLRFTKLRLPASMAFAPVAFRINFPFISPAMYAINFHRKPGKTQKSGLWITILSGTVLTKMGFKKKRKNITLESEEWWTIWDEIHLEVWVGTIVDDQPSCLDVAHPDRSLRSWDLDPGKAIGILLESLRASWWHGGGIWTLSVKPALACH